MTKKKSKDAPVEMNLAREVVIDLLRSDDPRSRSVIKLMQHTEMHPPREWMDAAVELKLMTYDGKKWDHTELGTSVARYVATPVSELPREYIAVFPNYYGRGESSDEAIAAAKKAGGRGPNYVVYRVPAGGLAPFVNQVGSGIMWTWHPGVPKDERDSAELEIVVDRSKRTG